MRFYLSGPITNEDPGMAQFNFQKGEEAVRKHGDEFINPESALRDIKLKHDQYIPINLAMLAQCDAILMLQGWRGSTGACIELGAALAYGVKVYELNENNRIKRFKI